MHTKDTLEEYIYRLKTDKTLSSVMLMVCIYILLVIWRPWEAIHYLQGFPVERIFAVILIIYAFLKHKLRIASSPTNKWVYGLLLIHFLFAPFAYNSEYAMDQGIEYAKIVVLYMLMVSVAEDERALNILVKVYVFSTMLYVFHSLLEYINGRHVYRMGIARMIGVDSTMNDPNAFGATIVLSLPFVYALLKSELSTKIRNIYYIYFAMAVTCVVLTGSRSSFVATMVLFLIWMIIQKGRKKIRLFLMLLLFLPLIWIAMPQDKQDRFSTLWDEEAGPENAQQSAEGRKEGWIVSWRIFKQNPLTGVGAGGKNFIGYRLDHGIDDEGHASATQSHNLYGEVLAEFGAVGGILLIGLIASIWRSSSKARSYLEIKGLQDCFEYRLGGAIIASLVLLLVFGLAGHNFYRPLWLWLAAWAGILLKVVRLKRIDNER